LVGSTKIKGHVRVEHLPEDNDHKEQKSNLDKDLKATKNQILENNASTHNNKQQERKTVGGVEVGVDIIQQTQHPPLTDRLSFHVVAYLRSASSPLFRVLHLSRRRRGKTGLFGIVEQKPHGGLPLDR